MDFIHIQIHIGVVLLITVRLANDVFQIRVVAWLHYIVGCFPQADVVSPCDGCTVIGPAIGRVDGVGIIKVVVTVNAIGLGLC